MRLELAQYRELAAFAQFGSDLDKSSQDALNRGKRWVEVLKQGPYSPIPVEKQVAIIFAGGQGFLDDMKVEDVRRFEAELYKYLDNSKPEILQGIRDKRELNDDLKNQLKTAIQEVKKNFGEKAKAPEAPRNAAGGNRNGGQPDRVQGQVDKEAEKLKSSV